MTTLALLIAKPALGIIAAALVSLVPQTRAVRTDHGICLITPWRGGGITIGPTIIIAQAIDYSSKRRRSESISARTSLIKHEEIHVRNNYESPVLSLSLDVLSLAWALLAQASPKVFEQYDHVPWERTLR